MEDSLSFYSAFRNNGLTIDLINDQIHYNLRTFLIDLNKKGLVLQNFLRLRNKKDP